MADRNDPSQFRSAPASSYVPSQESGVSGTARPGNSPTSLSHRSSWNTNAVPFHPSFQSCQQNVPPYVDAPMYDDYYPPYMFQERQGFGQQPLPQFTPYMDSVDAEGLDVAGVAYDGAYGMTSLTAVSQQFALSPDLCERMMYSSNAALLQEVQVGLEQLMCEPDEFETWSGAIRDRLVDKSICDDSLKITADMILQMATLTSSVQYNFSRLCALLCREVRDFRQKYLIPMLHSFHEKQRKCMNCEQMQNLLLFFAELYDKLETDTKERLVVLGSAVYTQVADLLNLQNVNDGSVKSVIQVLKLTGRHLENDIQDGVTKLDYLFTSLNAIAKGHPGISESIKQQIVSLSSLRANNWGMRNHEPKAHLATEPSDATLAASTSSAFIIGPDGQPLSDEEKAFLEENFGRLDTSDANDSTVESAIDDSDVADDYEQFLSEVASLPASEANGDVSSATASLSKMGLHGVALKTDSEGSQPDQK